VAGNVKTNPLERRNDMNVNTRIKTAQRQNERDVLAHVRQHGQVCHIGVSVPWLNAIRRLQEAGRIRHDSYRLGWVLADERARR
jgi:hypothetical protein